MKRLISIVSAVAVAASSFVAMATVSSAASVAANSNPAINVTFAEYSQEDGGAIFYGDLVNNEVLSYSTGSMGKITSNGINMIEFHITLDTSVFDVSESVIWVEDGSTASNVSGDGTADLTYAFTPSAPAGYMAAAPEHLFGFFAPLQAGYSETNIPDSAATITSAIVEYTAYNNVKPSSGATYYTIYGYNVPTKDYILSVSFTGVTSGGGDPAPVVADVDSTTGEVTFDRTNATLPASAVLDGQTVKVFSNEFTGVTANKRFSITHTPSATTKKYGTTIGEYFGISGAGTVDGIVKVAILFPEGMNASDFTIGMYDAE